MEIDPGRSTATFRLKVQNLKNLKGSALSPPCYVQNLPWSIMVMTKKKPSGRKHHLTKALAIYIRCNGDSKSGSWSCFATAELRLLSYNPRVAPHTRNIQKLFHSKSNEWGFSQFITWSLVFEPISEYTDDGEITVEVELTAETPHGVLWDFRRYPGYVGLKYEPISFYMNSLLQTLYFTNELRKAIYNIPAVSTSVSVLALQTVFYELQFSDKQVHTNKLLKSLGLDKPDFFKKLDIKKFLKASFDYFESKMKGSSVEGVISRLFQGKMTNYTKCNLVNVSVINEDTYYGIELDIKGKKNIEESLEEYLNLKMLDGDNKFDAGEHGLQEAVKGTLFTSFPPVLLLHLMKFQYDPITDGFVNNVKSNNLYKFYEHINLDAYLQEKMETPADYTLHAVLVHSGDSNGGQYVAFIDPKCDGKWWKFEKEMVSRCSKQQAVDENYGGRKEANTLGAYMLVYIRDAHLKSVLQDVTRDDIPPELRERIAEQMRKNLIPDEEPPGEMQQSEALDVQLPECPVCLDLLSLPIYQCQSGHCVCNSCLMHLKCLICPVCRNPFTQIRNWPLEDIITQLTRLEDTESQMEKVKSRVTLRFTVDYLNKVTDDQKLLSRPTYFRNLAWNIMMSRRIHRRPPWQTNSNAFLAFFLQCNGDSCTSTDWSCYVNADLCLLSFKRKRKPYTKKIRHLFNSKENDWGFPHFMPWEDVLKISNGYVMNNTIILEVNIESIEIELPEEEVEDLTQGEGLIPYVGLKNEGATCYMNSLLQALYFTNELRMAVFEMPKESDDPPRSVGSVLQRVFYELQTSKRPVSAKNLIRCLGWDKPNPYTQRDGQEFLRLLIDKLEGQMKDTCVNNVIPALFEGKMVVNIKCKNVKVTSVRLESFYDIQLDIKGNKNIHDAFKAYTKLEILDGDNKYYAGKHGLQRAEKRVKFVQLPPVLHLHLMRFQYDVDAKSAVKSNDRFEFYEFLSLDEYLEGTSDTPLDYTLHAVLVHSGDSNGGHYVVFIDPKCNGNWWKFNDRVVSSSTKEEAIEDNYGHDGDDADTSRHIGNAYMLVYIRDADRKTVLEDVTTADISAELIERLAEDSACESMEPEEATSSGSSSITTVNIPDCPACLAPFTPPIYQCVSGHSLCHMCTQNLEVPECPVCQDHLTRTRNIMLEQIISKTD